MTAPNSKLMVESSTVAGNTRLISSMTSFPLKIAVPKSNRKTSLM